MSLPKSSEWTEKEDAACGATAGVEEDATSLSTLPATAASVPDGWVGNEKVGVNVSHAEGDRSPDLHGKARWTHS